METRMWMVLVTALIPLITGSIWYNPKVFGKAWIKSTGLTEEQLRQANMIKIFALTYVFGVFISLGLSAMVIHQFHILSIFADDPGAKIPGSETDVFIKNFMADYGDRYRTFKHGAFHGTLAGIFLALPITGIIALFERKSAKYIFIHTGYWIVTMALIGGVLCQFV